MPSLVPQCVYMVLAATTTAMIMEATATVTLLSSVTHNYTTFVSDYIRLESSTPIDWFEAVDMCKNYGPGWDIAGIYSADGNAAVSTMLTGTPNNQGFFGGIIPAPSWNTNENLYVWYGGRFRGTRISRYNSPYTQCLTTWCHFRGGQPDTYDCFDDSGATVWERAFHLYPNGEWNNVAPEGCVGDTSSIAVCERSACSVQVDCDPTKTNSVSGSYAPACTCICKPGYRGARCQALTSMITINNTDYGVSCDVSPINVSYAETRCASLGSGWTLASIPTPEVNTALQTLTPDRMWTGGVYAGGGNFKWQYGRFKDDLLCLNGLYCDWAPGQPDRADCGDGQGDQSYIIVREGTSARQWDDMWSDVCGLQDVNSVYCYACERSPCLQSDCPKGSRPRNAYYPCTCQTYTASLVLTTTMEATNTNGTLSLSNGNYTMSFSQQRTSVSIVPTLTKSLPVSTSRTIQPTASKTSSGSNNINTTTLTGVSTKTVPPIPTGTMTLSNPLTATPTHSFFKTATVLQHGKPITATATLPPIDVQHTHTTTVATTPPQQPPHHTPSHTTTMPPILHQTETMRLQLSQTSSLKRSVGIPSPQQNNRTTTNTTTTPTSTPAQMAPISFTNTASMGHSSTSSIAPEHTPTAEIAANTTLIDQMLSLFPLFEDFNVDEEAVRSGSTRLLNPIHDSTALWELLLSTDRRGRRVLAMGIPIVAAVPALGPVGVTGNEKGFFLAHPNTMLMMPNRTTLNLTMSALPQYSIAIGERLLLFTSMRELLDVPMLKDHRNVDKLHLVGTIAVIKPQADMTVPAIVSTAFSSIGGIAGGMAAELQGIGALAMMGCSDPNTKSSFGSYRVLSPLAVMDSYAGVIIGNALLTGAVGLIQIVVVLVLRLCQRVQRTTQLMATARFPSFFITAALAFHTGTAFASARLVSQPGNYAAWEVFVGVAGLVYSLVLPVAMAAHPYLRVGRAYQEYSMAKWLQARRWPAWVVWVVPRGALYSLETRQVYGIYISAYRAPPRQVLWTSLPTWTPLVFLVAGLFHPNTAPTCQAQFICMGVAMVVIAVLVVWRAPLRANMAGWLDAASRLTLGCVMFCMVAAIIDGKRLNVQASDAAFAFIVVLMAITALRVLHHLLCMYVDYAIEQETTAPALKTVWVHLVGSDKNKTLQFTNIEDDSLVAIAGDRGGNHKTDAAIQNSTNNNNTNSSTNTTAVPMLQVEVPLILKEHGSSRTDTHRSNSISSSISFSAADEELRSMDEEGQSAPKRPSGANNNNNNNTLTPRTDNSDDFSTPSIHNAGCDLEDSLSLKSSDTITNNTKNKIKKRAMKDVGESLSLNSEMSDHRNNDGVGEEESLSLSDDFPPAPTRMISSDDLPI